MHASADDPDRRGRLHGRLLQILGVVSAVAVLIALWQFGVFGDEPDREAVDAVDGPETLALSSAADDTSAVEATLTASSTSESPSESTAPETTAALSSESALTPSSTVEAEEAGQEVATASACSASLVLKREWDGGIEVSGTVVNTGSEAIESWEIDLDFTGAEIYHYWDMRRLDGHRYANEDWNGRLEPDGNAMLGFLANADSDFELPDSVPCTARV